MSRDTFSSGVPSSKVLDKLRTLTEKEPAEAASKGTAEKLKKSDESSLPEISKFKVWSAAPLFTNWPEEPESRATDGTELFEDSQLTNFSKAIQSNPKETKQVDRQDWKTFGMVVQMLLENDPSLEKPIEFGLSRTCLQ